MTVQAIAEAAAIEIRDENHDRANTAQRVGSLFLYIAENGLFGVTAEAAGATPGASAATNQTAFQSALNAIGLLGGGVLDVGPGVFALTGNLVVSSDTHIRLTPNTTLDISSAANSTVAITGTGTEGATMALTANASVGAASISLSAPDAATLAFGDYMRIASNAQFDANDTNSEIGEVVRVASVSGTTVTLEEPLRGGPYNTADSAVASKITFLTGVRVSGGKILGGGTTTTAGSDKDHVGVSLFLAKDCSVEGLQCERTDLKGVWFRDSIFCRVSGCHFQDFINDTEAYGVSWDNACQDCVMSECSGERVRHLVTTNNSTATKGVTRRITIDNCKVFSTATARGGTGGDAFDTHTAAEDITFSNCTVYSSTGSGFNAECPSVTFDNCEARSCSDYSFHHKNESDAEGITNMVNCRAYGNTLEAFRVDMPIRGSTARYRAINIHNCKSYDSVSMSFYVLNSLGSTTLRNVSVVGCLSVACQSATSAYYLENCENVTFSGNIVGDPTNTGAFLVRFRDCTNVEVGANSVQGATSATGAAYWVNASGAGTCQKIHIAGNRAGCTTPSGFRGVVLDNNATNCTIGINDFQELAVPLSLGTGTGHKLLQSAEVSADKGNAAFTVLHYSEQTLLWNTPITADRAVTLPAANVKARFRIVRGAGATGAFNLNVGSGPLKALAAASTWCDVESNGTAYVLTAAGTL